MSEINELELFIRSDVLNELEFYFSEHINLMELEGRPDVEEAHRLEFPKWFWEKVLTDLKNMIKLRM